MGKNVNMAIAPCMHVRRGTRLFEVGPNSRLDAHSNTYGIPD